MRLQQISRLWKDVTITSAGAACVYLAISFGGDLWPLRNGPQISVGFPISIPGESTTDRHRELIIIGSNLCRFSRASVEFDRKLQGTAASVGLPVHIITPTSKSAAWYSDQLSLPSSSILVHSLVSLGVRGTPTVILRDESGIVKGLWEGLLSTTEQHAVLARIGERKHIIEQPHFEGVIFSPGDSAPSLPARAPFEIDENSLHTLGMKNTVIDLRERDSFSPTEVPNAVNIPFRELDVRARIELNHDNSVIVDCSSINVATCDLGALELVTLGFASVSVLDRGSGGRACGISPVGNHGSYW